MWTLTRRFTAALAAALTLGWGAAALPPASAADDEPVVFTIGMLQDVDSLNPFNGIVIEAFEMWQLQYPTLTDFSADTLGIVPDLAESWEESPDKKTWTYNLVPGATWSDGTPLTAKDVVYTFNRIKDGKREKTNYGNYTRNIESVEAIDDTTVVMTVKEPSPLMDHLGVYILPEHVWKEIDAKELKSFSNEPENGEPLVGGGPFLIAERRPGQFIRLVKNPNYYGDQPAIDELVFRIYTNADALGQALIKGEVDFAEKLTPDVFTSLQGKEGITTVAAISSAFSELAFNTGAALYDGTPIGNGNPHLKDVAVRQAISHAIDRQQLVDRILGGYGTPGTTVIPPFYPEYHLEPASEEVSYDPELAKSLLDDAGYTEGPDGIRIGPDGKPMSYEIMVRTDEDASVKSGEFFRSYLADIGIEATVKPVSEDTLYEKVGAGDFDMFEWGWGVDPDPDFMLSTFTCGKRSYEEDGAVYADLSDSFYCNPEYDALYEQQAVETDPAARAAIVQQMQQMLLDDAVYALTWYSANLEAYRSDRFTGLVPQPAPDGPLAFQFGTWSYENVTPVTDEVVAETTTEGDEVTGDEAAADTATEETAASEPASEESGSSVPIIIGIVVIAAIVILVVVLLARRRGGSTDDRE